MLKRRTWRSPAFNYQFDGVVYAVFVSLGFALWENISYVATYGFQVAFAAGGDCHSGHACFGVFMGAWYGTAKKYEKLGNAEKSKTLPAFGCLMPVFLHGMIFYRFPESAVCTWVFIGICDCLFTVAWHMVKRLSAHDHYWARFV